MKSPQRVFLDWRRPALTSAVEYLRRKYASGESSPPAASKSPAGKPSKRKAQSEGQRLFGFDEPPADAPVANSGGATWDLSRVIVVVPGRRAGRRLLELLVFAARDHGLFFTPPTITTEGKLPELLYVPKRPFADPLTQDLAWSQTLRQLKPKLRNAIVPHAPEKEDETAWLQLGQMLRQRHTELAADQLTFDDVVKQGAKLPSFPDALRWEAMRAAQEQYLLTLDDLQLWDIQTARLKAIEFKEIRTDLDIVLLGTVDLNRTMRAMLDAVAERVTALIPAPESLAERFDAHGCVIPEQWLTAEIPVRDEQVLRVDGPADQADATAKILAEYDGKYRGDEISIGVPDEKLVPHLQRQLEQCGVPVRWVEGKLLPQTGPYRLLAAAAELIRNNTLRSLAAMVRHPDVFVRLTTATEPERVELTLLNELDRLQADYLVTRLNPKSWPFEVRRKLEQNEAFGSVAKAIEQVTKLLAPLNAKPQRLAAWSQPIMQVLASCYGDLSCDPATVAALEKIRNCVQTQSLLPERLDPALSAAEAIEWVLQQLRGELIPPSPAEEAVELLGWLELPLDDAPALIVTSFNEGFTPQASGDSFLPNTLRKSLGLLDNDRRYARDAYAVSTLLASRESVHLISARRDAENNPLVPSRLLFATEPDRVVQRSRRFFKPLEGVQPRMPLVGAGLVAPDKSRLFVPRPGECDALNQLRVTQFRDYLACPYRFYLRHVLRLEALDDTCEELPANAFGNLIHKVLERFGANKDIRDSAKHEDIFDFLKEQLRLAVAQRYGDQDLLPAVEIQIEQIRSRLRRFAEMQADHRSQGWRIAYSETTRDDANPSEELPQKDRAEVIVDNQPFMLIGRIDRIDEHEDGGRFQIFDYKTGDRCQKPEQVHRSRGEWVDLQLPLYRHLAEAWGYEGELELGYIVIPKSLQEIDVAIARWSEAELAAADETMRSVVRRVRRREFWEPGAAPAWDDEFTAICQDRRLGGRHYEEVLAVAGQEATR